MVGIKCEREYKFARDAIGNPKKGIREKLKRAGLKDWRFDFAIPHKKIAVEIEGGVFTNGRHVQGMGFQNDCEKYNQALLLGWRVLRFTCNHVKSGHALTLTEKLYDSVKRVGAHSERREEPQAAFNFNGGSQTDDTARG